MASYQKFNFFVDYLCRGGVNLATDTIKVMLTNSAPSPTNKKYSDVSGNELAAGNGYVTGGAAVPGTGLSNSNGTETFAAGMTTFTSNTGAMGPFRYAIYYDVTAPDSPLIGFTDYGNQISLNGAAGETFQLTPNNGVLFSLA